MFGGGRSPRRFSLDLEREDATPCISLLRQDLTLLARRAGHYLSTSYYSTVLTSLFLSLSVSLTPVRICRHDRNGRARGSGN